MELEGGGINSDVPGGSREPEVVMRVVVVLG